MNAVAGEGPDDRPPPEPPEDHAPFRSGGAWFVPLSGVDGYWVELGNGDREAARRVEPMLSRLLGGEEDSLRMARELADRYAEIELLYTISETLAHTLYLEDATRVIVREVGAVVGARRASILVHDPSADLLRPVAGWGIDVKDFEAIAVDDPMSIAARVFRECRAVNYEPGVSGEHPISREGRTYRGAAFLSVPIMHPAPSGIDRPIGVINLTDRTGKDAFSDGDERLITAVASQIGVAIENARLVERDRRQQRLRRELELAHDLQLKLLKPHPVGPDDLAARCRPAESVGGDFYYVAHLPHDRLGVMLGDVSSHGFSAALIMALVLSAAGIHAQEAGSPDEAMRRLLESVGDELAEAEMYLTMFYGVADRAGGVLRYANAGHPHAFRVDGEGTAHRLVATSPPLGLVAAETIVGTEVPWHAGGDLLVLFSDGLTDAHGVDGERFGEERVLEQVRAHRQEPAERIVSAVFAAVERFAPSQRDDRTILVLHA